MEKSILVTFFRQQPLSSRNKLSPCLLTLRIKQLNCFFFFWSHRHKRTAEEQSRACSFFSGTISVLLLLTGQIYPAENGGTKGRICDDDVQKRNKKTTQEPTGLTHSNASQMLLWFLLLISHGAIYYCRTHNTTQAISLLDDLYLILKSVLHKYGTVRFQPHLITRCHGGASITGMMRTGLIHSPGLPR